LVVINADLVYAYNNLFPTSTSHSYAKSLQKRAGSCSSISFYWALSKKIPELNTHNIFLADEYRESFDSIFDRQSIPVEPSFYVNVPSRIDPTAAPEGKDSIVVLVPVGHLLNSATASHPDGDDTATSGPGLKPEQDWTTLVTSTRQKILSTIESRTGCSPLSPLIVHEELNSPTTWESTFNLDKGSILGLSHSFFNVLAFRPKTKHPQIEGVYLVGASTHPGTGVPIVLAGAKITVEQVLGDRGDVVPWEGKEDVVRDQGVRQGKGMRELDRVVRRGALLSDVGIWLLAIVVLVSTLAYLNSGLVVGWDPEGKRGWGSGRV
jgi:phytoene desaturase (3,4-didehydrolycopene-forming)